MIVSHIDLFSTYQSSDDVLACFGLSAIPCLETNLRKNLKNSSACKKLSIEALMEKIKKEIFGEKLVWKSVKVNTKKNIFWPFVAFLAFFGLFKAFLAGAESYVFTKSCNFRVDCSSTRGKLSVEASVENIKLQFLEKREFEFWEKSIVLALCGLLIGPSNFQYYNKNLKILYWVPFYKRIKGRGLDEKKPIILEKNEFENRENSVVLERFCIFGLARHGDAMNEIPGFSAECFSICWKRSAKRLRRKF